MIIVEFLGRRPFYVAAAAAVTVAASASASVATAAAAAAAVVVGELREEYDIEYTLIRTAIA